ncbi:unnamed protein product [Ilex paraguariensis]|uniref:Uncharacterized protein n=1 Tax=Ilex paraguariensis TaxID=185542 RepID=A0ABC8TW13_9AQUA
MREVHLGSPLTVRSHGVTLARTHVHDWLILALLVMIEVVLNVINPFYRFVGKNMTTDLKYSLKDNTISLWAVPVSDFSPLFVNKTAVISIGVVIIFTILATNTMGWRDHRKGSYYRMLMNLHSKAIEVIIAPLVRPQAQVQRPVNPGLKRRGPGGAWDLQGPGGQNCSGLPQKMVIHIERVTPDKENGSMVNVTKVVVTKLKLDIGPEGFCLTGRPREGKGC